MDTAVLDVALLVLATGRLTRLAVVDAIAEPFRDGVRWLGWRAGGDTGLVLADDLVGCPHCIGFWIAAAVVASYAAWAGPWWRIAAGVLAVSYAAGHLVAWLDAEPEG